MWPSQGSSIDASDGFASRAKGANLPDAKLLLTGNTCLHLWEGQETPPAQNLAVFAEQIDN